MTGIIPLAQMSIEQLLVEAGYCREEARRLGREVQAYKKGEDRGVDSQIWLARVYKEWGRAFSAEAEGRKKEVEVG